MGYSSETHLKRISGEISFAHNLIVNYPMILKCCTGHTNDTVARDFARFQIKMCFRRIFGIAQGLCASGTLQHVLSLLILCLFHRQCKKIRNHHLVHLMLSMVNMHQHILLRNI